jgi:regulator of sigma E protease
MSHFLISILAMAAVLGVMIVIHELGHYVAAKYFKVRVEVFSIGFGTRLAGFRKGDTDYRISAIPLGGYVKMSGENPMDERTGDPAEFLAHPRWQRFIIAFAGPAMNILLAVGLLTFVFMFHLEQPLYYDQPALIGWVMQGTPAAKAGLQPGDKIIKLEDVDSPTWQQVDPKENLSPNQPLHLTIQRGNQTLEKVVTPEPYGISQIGYAGWVPKEPNIVTKLDAGMPAEKAGLQEGDEIIAMNGKPLPAVAAMVEALKQSKDKPIEVAVLRNGQQKNFTIQPVLSDVPGLREQRYRIGIEAEPTKVVSLPFAAAFNRSIEENKRASMLILELVQKMVRRKVSIRTIEGPIRIGQAAGAAASEKGWNPLLLLTAAISLNLGIFNLLPIPILDGGVILLLLIEGLMRRDISLQIKERIYQAAFVFLLLFAVMVIYNDLVKTLPGLSTRLP